MQFGKGHYKEHLSKFIFFQFSAVVQLSLKDFFYFWSVRPYMDVPHSGTEKRNATFANIRLN